MPGKMETLLLTVTAIFGLFTLFIINFVIYYRTRQKRNSLEKRELLTAFQQEKLQATIEIQEYTFNMLSQELHDNVGQILSFARMQLHNQTAAHHETIENTDELIGKAISELRSLSHNLNTGNIQDIGLVNASRDLLERIEKTGHYKTMFNYDGHTLHQKDSGIIIFRMIQEIINNIIKHADGTLINMKIFESAGKSCIEISDNGKGYQPDNIKNGIGIKNLLERAEVANTDIHFISTPDKGTSIKIITR